MNNTAKVIDFNGYKQEKIVFVGNKAKLAIEMQTQETHESGCNIGHIAEMVKTKEGKALHKNIKLNKKELGHTKSPRKSVNKELFEICQKYGIPYEYVNGSGKDGLKYIESIMATKRFTPVELLAYKLTHYIGVSTGADIFNSKSYREDQEFKINNALYQKTNRLIRKEEMTGKNYCDGMTYNDIAQRNYQTSKRVKKMLDESPSLLKTEDEKMVEGYDNSKNLIEVDVFNTNIGRQELIDMDKYNNSLKNNLPTLTYDNIENYSTVLIGNKLFLRIEKTCMGYAIYSLTDEQYVDIVPSKKYFVAMITNLIFDMATSEITPEQALNLYARQVLVASPSEYKFNINRKFK